ncbi:MAG TPA: hypothetical protein VLH14_00445, partial [Patescibacteria group bacterium]|nr:hypothetical protein [Patescibacteria group bacterium]
MLVFVAIATGAYFYGPIAVDAVRASSFHPNTDITGVDSRINLTTRGRQIFYATTPIIEDRDAFNTDCESVERTAAILGCYVRDRIYLYNIQGSELDGALEVTAAHEMLHAAYARLNIFEQASVNKMINAEYAKIKDEPDIKQEMQYYAQAEPGEELNELHSIIGTTIKDLPADLEQYYARYFTNRAAIVAMNVKYTAVFDEVNQQALTLQDQITNESAAIKQASTQYNADLTQLNSDIESFNERATSGGFTSQYAFTVAHQALSERIQQMKDRQTTLNQQIDTYNADVAEYNKLAGR